MCLRAFLASATKPDETMHEIIESTTGGILLAEALRDLHKIARAVNG
jgi:hypothetical protein